METKAVARYIRISPRKARLVVDMIRGRDVATAEQILDFSDKGAARVVSKVLHSAVANAENNNALPAEGLYVSKVFVDEGPTLKRFRPRAMGRATRINKRTCHITMILDEREPAKITSRRRRRKAEKAAAVTEATAAAQPEPEEPSDAVTETKSEEPSGEDTVKKPAAKKAAAKKAGAKKPAAKKPAAKAKKPAAKPESKAAKKPAAKKAAKKAESKPAAKKPATKKAAEPKADDKKSEE